MPALRLLGENGEREPGTAELEHGMEREELLELLAHQQRIAQAGLVTAGLAHDVCNHVQTMSGAAYLALESLKPGDWREALKTVQEQCCALTETTNAFLAFLRRRDDADLDRFELADIVEQAVRLLRPLARTEGVNLTRAVKRDAVVVGDARTAIQALVNLTSNAIRACAGRPGVEGEVEITATCPIEQTARLEVRDNGPGISDAMRPRLFRPFATAHGATGGTGLGLFIVRQSVRRLNGSIRLATSSTGTTVTIDLPCV